MITKGRFRLCLAVTVERPRPGQAKRPVHLSCAGSPSATERLCPSRPTAIQALLPAPFQRLQDQLGQVAAIRQQDLRAGCRVLLDRVEQRFQRRLVARRHRNFRRHDDAVLAHPPPARCRRRQTPPGPSSSCLLQGRRTSSGAELPASRPSPPPAAGAPHGSARGALHSHEAPARRPPPPSSSPCSAFLRRVLLLDLLEDLVRSRRRAEPRPRPSGPGSSPCTVRSSLLIFVPSDHNTAQLRPARPVGRSAPSAEAPRGKSTTSHHPGTGRSLESPGAARQPGTGTEGRRAGVAQSRGRCTHRPPLRTTTASTAAAADERASPSPNTDVRTNARSSPSTTSSTKNDRIRGIQRIAHVRGKKLTLTGRIRLELDLTTHDPIPTTRWRVFGQAPRSDRTVAQAASPATTASTEAAAGFRKEHRTAPSCGPGGRSQARRRGPRRASASRGRRSGPGAGLAPPRPPCASRGGSRSDRASRCARGAASIATLKHSGAAVFKKKAGLEDTVLRSPRRPAPQPRARRRARGRRCPARARHRRARGRRAAPGIPKASNVSPEAGAAPRGGDTEHSSAGAEESEREEPRRRELRGYDPVGAATEKRRDEEPGRGHRADARHGERKTPARPGRTRSSSRRRSAARATKERCAG